MHDGLLVTVCFYLSERKDTFLCFVFRVSCLFFDPSDDQRHFTYSKQKTSGDAFQN